MSSAKLTIQEMRDMIHKGELKDPLVFLESVMCGHDPRQVSDIYKLVLEIEEFSDGPPSSSDWADIVDVVTTRYKYHTVSLADSNGAAKTLAEYLHAKRKHVELNGGLTQGSAATEPLNEHEIALFKEKFNSNF